MIKMKIDELKYELNELKDLKKFLKNNIDDLEIDEILYNYELYDDSLI